MSKRARVFERLVGLITDNLSVNQEEIQEDSSFRDDLGADSLDIVDLVMGIEDEFNIEIPDDHVEQIACVRDAIEYILAHASLE
jgi:acyl carrier protein